MEKHPDCCAGVYFLLQLLDTVWLCYILQLSGISSVIQVAPLHCRSTNKPFLFYTILYRSSAESRAFSSHSTWAFMDATNMLFLVCLCILFKWHVLLLSTCTYSLMHVCTHGIAERIHAGSLSIWLQFVQSCVCEAELIHSLISEHVKSLVVDVMHISGNCMMLPQFTNTLAESSRKGVWCFEAKQGRHGPKG